jgi:aspartyl-tRNA(Asn)/glutamyl-tRNA(Gln) amidotransferase subunit A
MSLAPTFSAFRPISLAQSAALPTAQLQTLAASAAAQHVFITALWREPRVDTGALHNVAISVKDLYDTAGQVTTAGSRALAGSAPAQADAPAVARVRAAGARIIGRTNMTEFAYSGVGYNPHYGTPVNPCDAQVARIPGGSSSGGAVSVALGLAGAALGSDTGGSVRIPAALCGIVGFKCTQSLVPKVGIAPLSTTLDTACAMTSSVADAVVVHNVIADVRVTPVSRSPDQLRFALPTRVLCEGLDATVETAFARTVQRLRDAGCTIIERDFAPLDELAIFAHKGGFSAAESCAHYAQVLATARELLDPRVLVRMERGLDQTVADYLQLTAARKAWISRMNALLTDVDAFICPTVPMVAPPIALVEASLESFADINAQLLRNTSVGNLLDGCSISLPCHVAGELPVGLMLTAPRLHDAQLLGAALAVEKVLAL